MGKHPSMAFCIFNTSLLDALKMLFHYSLQLTKENPLKKVRNKNSK